MLTLADVVRQHGPSYRARFGARLLPSHVRAMNDILTCRTPAMGGHIEECIECGHREIIHHSCRNRACASCGGERAAQWVARQHDLLLPVPYFHVVFTLPAELRELVRRHQKTLLPVLCRAAFQSLASLCRDPRHLGGEIGALAVLHTWTRALQWHPHVHLLVPGGGLAPDGAWIPSRRRRSTREPYLVPVAALSTKFWGLFLHQARRALPNVTFPNLGRQKRWVVHAKPVLRGGGRVIEYLGRYIHRTAITERALISCDEHRVTFRYRDNRDGLRKVTTVAGHEFLRRYLQHVLPRGLHRVRVFGLLHPSKRATLRRLQLLLARSQKPSQVSPSPRPKARPYPCSDCGATQWRRGPRLTAINCIAVAHGATLQNPESARGPPS